MFLAYSFVMTHKDGQLRELTVRRKSQGDGWGFVPALQSKPLFPKSLITRFSLVPTAARDVLTFAGIDVVISRKALAFRRHSFGIFKEIKRVTLQDYIGVAVHYTPAPRRWRFADLKTLNGYRPFIPSFLKSIIAKKVTSKIPAGQFQRALEVLFAEDVLFKDREEGVVSLYLLHEDRSKDLLLYYADHEDEIQALWRFWSERLRLPRLLVGPDGFIDEPFAPLNQVEVNSPQPRRPFYHLDRRGPHFARVRDVGQSFEVTRRSPRVRGREISARS